MLIFKLFPLISFHLKTFNILVSRKMANSELQGFSSAKLILLLKETILLPTYFAFFLEAAFLKCGNMLFIAYQAYTKRHPNVR